MPKQFVKEQGRSCTHCCAWGYPGGVAVSTQRPSRQAFEQALRERVARGLEGVFASDASRNNEGHTAYESSLRTQLRCSFRVSVNYNLNGSLDQHCMVSFNSETHPSLPNVLFEDLVLSIDAPVPSPVGVRNVSYLVEYDGIVSPEPRMVVRSILQSNRLDTSLVSRPPELQLGNFPEPPTITIINQRSAP